MHASAKGSVPLMLLSLALVLPATSTRVRAGDWPQWRGPNCDAKAADFTAPKTWPKELTQKWKVAVGDGVATPALVGDKLYVFSRQDGNEVIRCLEAANGKELWADKYETAGAAGPAQSFSGPRSSPAVAEGKVVTLGVRGVLSCVDAAKGTKLWRRDDFPGAYPRFFPSSSPMILDGLCIVQVGGQGNGGVVAYDLTTGEPKWKWLGDAPAYSSPVLMTVSGTKLIIAMTESKLVALTAANGQLAWETPFSVQGRGYIAATPMVDGQTLIYAGSGRGVKAVKLEKDGDHFTSKELWSNPDKSVQFNTPVLKSGFLYGLTGSDQLFCLNAQNGEATWSAPVAAPSPAPAAPEAATKTSAGEPTMGATNATRAPGMGGPGGRGPGGRGMGGGRAAGYGSLVDAGSVLLALTPAAELIVFKPDAKAYTEKARYKVAESQTYAYPVVSDKRIFIKDRDSLVLWTLE